MATIRPFRAVRPAADKAENVIALPYDVMNRQEAAEMAEGKPYSFLHISRAEIDLSFLEDPYSKAVYQKGRENFDRMQEEGVYLQDENPCLYIYRQEMNGRYQTGIVGCFSIDEYENNIIRKHELTRLEKEVDRISHFDACSANTEPVFLTYRRNSHIDQMIADFISGKQPVYDFYSKDGIGHSLWVLDDDMLIERVCREFSRIDRLYIADGHHRSASACEVGKKRRSENPDYDGTEEFNYFMAVIFPDSDLKIYDYNRVVKDLNGFTKEELLDEISKAGFIVTCQGERPYRPEKTHEFSIYLDGNWYKMETRPELVPENVIGALDVSILQDNVLGPILGIGDPRTDSRIDFVGGIRGLEELSRRADSDMKLAFAVYPVTMEELMNIADCGEIMPPKSTWFEPKLGSGLFIHKI